MILVCCFFCDLLKTYYGNMIFNKLIEDAEKAINEGKELEITNVF